MIYVTGDTHGDFGRFSRKKLKYSQICSAEKDYIIVCGDLGLCWQKDGTFSYNCRFFEQKDFTLLWVQGNHENYDMIEEFPLERWHGGKVRHIVRDKVILLERGQVFEIEGKKFFTFGGAASHDIQGGVLDRKDPEFWNKKRRALERELPFRILGESWWEQELPSEEEMKEGLENLAKHDNQVDYIITHCASTGVQDALDRSPGKLYKADILTDYLEEIERRVQYKHWYFGHYHDSRKVDEKHTLLYKIIFPLGEDSTMLADMPQFGKPKYVRGDIVTFTFGETEKTGKISIVDAYGTFGQQEEPSYDIMIEEENCLYKHIEESLIREKR